MGGWLKWAVCACVLLAATSTEATAAEVDPALEAALIGPLPQGGLRIGVTLRSDGLPAARSARRAALVGRREGVLGRVPPGDFQTRRTYRELAGFAGRAGRAAIAALRGDPDVETVYLDGVAYPVLLDGVALVGADSVQALGYTGLGVTVAVIDGGIDAAHIDLSDDLVAEQCYCDDNPLPFSGCCPDGSPEQSGPGAAADSEGHGTAVSGIITSAGVSTFVGMAPDAGIAALRVTETNGGASFTDIAAALDWVLTNAGTYNIKVVNISLGDGGEYSNAALSPCSGTLTANGIAALEAAGIAVFVSAGNDTHDNGISFPACVPQAISVGGVYDDALGRVRWCGATCAETLCVDDPTAADMFVCHTNSDELLDLLAPDWRTFTTELGGGGLNFGGTSAASPAAAGQAALLLEADPTLTPAQVKTLLKSHGPMVTDPDNGLMFRRADVGTALLFVIDTDADGHVDGGDNCRYRPNASQADQDGDGIGDVCQCGDVTGDGFVDQADADLIRASLADPVGAALAPDALARCPVHAGSAACDISQAAVLTRDVAALGPGLSQVCPAALP